MGPPVIVELINPDEPAESSKRWHLTETTIVGRGGEAEVVLAAPELSRHHLRLTPRPNGWFADDPGSRNGTHLNGAALGTEPAQLYDGDLLVLAGSVTLRFRDPMATPLAPRIGRLAGVWIDEETDAVWVDAQLVEPPLTERQFRLLLRLYRADGALISRPEAIAAAWHDSDGQGVTDGALTALIKRTRKRLAEFERGDPNIEIIRHRGIRLRIAD
ncbi:MAG: FHA domain-containing protein [Actinomycetota bacterium]